MIDDLPDTSTQEVSKRLVRLRDSGGAVALGRVLTLIISVEEGESAESAIEATNEASREHPCRVIVVARGSRSEPDRLDAQIRVGGDAGASEVVVLRLFGELADHGASVVTPFLLPDTPVVAWWPGAAPAVPAHNELGRLASRRITDTTSTDDPLEALVERRKGYRRGDSDLAWSKITPWRAILASALDQPPFEDIDSVDVTGPASSAETDLLAGWLAAQLGVEVRRKPGSFEVRLHRPHGHVALEFDQNSTAILSRTGQPDGRVAVRRRSVADCLTEELRRLDDDVVYSKALDGLSRVNRIGF